MRKNSFGQMNKEAACAVWLFVLFLFWWMVAALGGRNGKGGYIAGLPAWFFFGAIVGVPLFIVLIWILVRFVFEDDSNGPEDGSEFSDDIDSKQIRMEFPVPPQEPEKPAKSRRGARSK